MKIRSLAALVMIGVMTVMASVASADAGAQDDTERWRSVISALEPAAFVSLRLKDGRRATGTVLAAGERTFTFMPHTRIPVAAQEVTYEEIATLERARQGMNPGLKVLIAAGAGVGGLLLVVLTLIVAAGD